MAVKCNAPSRGGRSIRLVWLLLVAGMVSPALAAPVALVEFLRLHRDGGEVVLAGASPRLRLQPDDHDLRVDVADPGRRHRFWLEGHDAGWIAPAPGQTRLYQRLRPGTHRLRVQAMDASGRWSDRQEIDLLVEPPAWRRPPALVAAGLALLALGAAFAAWYRAHRARRQAWLLNQARRQLAEQQSEAKSRFLATLGHELRTPMTGVLGMAELLRDSALDPHQRGQVEAIQRAGGHLLRLLNDALDLARIEAGRLRLENAPFLTRPLLDEVAGLLRPLAAAKPLRLSLHCDPDVPVALSGDATRLRQILFNLGHNAIKFCGRGEVALRVRAASTCGIVVEVADTGPGLEPGLQARLFRRFESGAMAGDGTAGAGLGLAISQELAMAMGGAIHVRSRPGQGACFRLELPLRAAAEPESRAPVAVGAAAPRRVLLVEDEPLVAEVVSALLQRQGHRVVHAPQALAALAELEAGAFDLALLDLDLPGMDGLALARLLRARGHALPLVALTARSDAEAEPAAHAAGMDGFLRKPVTGEMLAGALASAGRGG